MHHWWQRREVVVAAAMTAATICGWLTVLSYGLWIVFATEPATDARRMAGPSLLVQQRLLSAPESQQEQILTQLSAQFGYPITRATLSGLQETGEELHRADDGLRVLDSAVRGMLRVARPLGDGTAILMGPLPNEPDPPAWFFIVGLVFVCLITGGSSYLLTAPLARRMNGLAKATAHIRRGELARRVKEGPNDAVGAFARSFNAMVDTVQQHVERQEHLLHAVAHELRTPLARVRFALEAMSDASSNGAFRRNHDSIDEDIEEIEQMVEELLTYAKFDSRAAPVKKESLDLGDIAADVVRKASTAQSRVNIKVKGACPTIVGERQHVHRALSNLLQNAMRFASKLILLELGEQERDGVRFATVVVGDDGPGIPQSDRERIFDPFARVEQSRNRAFGGVGLGLAIVKRVMTLHEGSVWVDDAPSGGARFHLWWPLAVNHSEAAPESKATLNELCRE
ncbi:MAG: ATP-binding protein [Myxococcota bacterium]